MWLDFEIISTQWRNPSRALPSSFLRKQESRGPCCGRQHTPARGLDPCVRRGDGRGHKASLPRAISRRNFSRDGGNGHRCRIVASGPALRGMPGVWNPGRPLHGRAPLQGIPARDRRAPARHYLCALRGFSAILGERNASWVAALLRCVYLCASLLPLIHWTGRDCSRKKSMAFSRRMRPAYQSASGWSIASCATRSASTSVTRRRASVQWPYAPST